MRWQISLKQKKKIQRFKFFGGQWFDAFYNKLGSIQQQLTNQYDIAAKIRELRQFVVKFENQKNGMPNGNWIRLIIVKIE